MRTRSLLARQEPPRRKPDEDRGKPEDVPSRVLVVRLGSLGDIVHTLPAVGLLASHTPDVAVHWLTERSWEPLLRCVPWVTKVWVADTHAWRRGRHLPGAIRLISSLREQEFGLAVDFQGLVKSAVLARLADPRIVRGFSRHRCREPWASVLYHEQIETDGGKRHMVEQHADLLDPPRCTERLSPRISFREPETAVTWVERELDLREMAAPVLLNLGGGWSTKRWAPERFGDLARRLIERLDLPVLLISGPGEAALVEAARAEAGRAVPWLCPDLPQLVALCRRSRLMVAGDTGPLHLAVACGTPTVALLGPALPWRTGPFNPRDEVVLHSPPCPHPYARRCTNHFCMDLSVDSVMSAVVRRLGLSG